MSAAARWSPHRIGAAVGALAWGSTILFLVYLFHVVAEGFGPPLWPFIPMLIALGATGAAMSSKYARRPIIPCPACGKSVFVLWYEDDAPRGPRAGLMWPESECSNCGRDLTEAPAAS